MRTKNDYVKGCKLNLNGCYPVFKNEIDPIDVFNIAFSTFTTPVHANFFTKLQCYYCKKEFTYRFVPKEGLRHVYYNTDLDCVYDCVVQQYAQ